MDLEPQILFQFCGIKKVNILFKKTVQVLF